MRAPPRQGRNRKWLVIAVLAVLTVVGSVVAAVAVSIRVETGEWRVPEKDDFVRIARRFDNKPSKTIFLERNLVDLKPGDDYAAGGVSSVVANAGNRPVRAGGWKGGDAKWKSVMSCVKKMFAPFDVRVTDQRPANEDFLMVVVGGKPTDIGAKSSHHVSGLAPFNGAVIPRAVVFSFAATVKHDPRAVCETIAMEVAHAYGLDHGYLCKDVMTYLSGCGAKAFVNKDVPCGEHKKRVCEGGNKTQNSYRYLVDVLGAARAPIK